MNDRKCEKLESYWDFHGRIGCEEKELENMKWLQIDDFIAELLEFIAASFPCSV